MQFPAANGWTARGAPACPSSCLHTSRCVARQPLFPTACEGAARALQGMLGREVFQVGEGDTWNSCCAGAPALEHPVTSELGRAHRVLSRFHWLREAAALWKEFSSQRIRAALLRPCGAWPGSDARLWPPAALPPLPFTLSVPVGGRGHRTRREVAAASNARETPLGRHHGARGTLGRVREPEEGEAKGALRLGRASLGLRWPGRGGERSLKGTTCQDPARAFEGRLPLAVLCPLRSGDHPHRHTPGSGGERT